MKERHHRQSKKDKINLLTKMLHKIYRQGEAIENQLTDFKTGARKYEEPLPQFSVDTKSLKKIHEKLSKLEQKYVENGEKSFLESSTLSSAENHREMSVLIRNSNFFDFIDDSTGDDDDGEGINQSLFSKRNPKRRHNIFLKEKDKSKSDDELLLVIENNYDDGDSGVHVAAATTIESVPSVPGSACNNNDDENRCAVVYDEQQWSRQHEDYDDDEVVKTSKTINRTVQGMGASSCELPTGDDENIIKNGDFQEYHRIPKAKTNAIVMDTTPKRKFRRKCDLSSLRQHKLTSTSKSTELFDESPQKYTVKKSRYEMIRDEISNKMFEHRGLVKREEILTGQLALKYGMYKAENELYTTKLGLDMCIEAVQENLDRITKDILENEQEIFETKMAIVQTQAILDRLKEMMKLERQAMRCGIFNFEMPTKSTQKLNCSAEFADNIHEFCDNNASMIV